MKENCLECKKIISRKENRICGGWCYSCNARKFRMIFSLWCLRENGLGGKKYEDLSDKDIFYAMKRGLQIKPDFKIKDLYPDIPHE